MKQLIIVLISIGCALFSLAQDQPKAVADLVSKRDAARSKANEAFMVKVVKLQSTYSKNGDVESAKKLADLINDSAGKDYKSYPSAARGFAATRDRDFKRINEIFIRELVKLQSKYTASGDFENAKKVAALISESVDKARTKKNSLDEILRSREWEYSTGTTVSKIVFRSFGKARMKGFTNAEIDWNVSENRYLTIVYTDGNSCKFDFKDLSKLSVKGITRRDKKTRTLAPAKKLE